MRLSVVWLGWLSWDEGRGARSRLTAWQRLRGVGGARHWATSCRATGAARGVRSRGGALAAALRKQYLARLAARSAGGGGGDDDDDLFDLGLSEDGDEGEDEDDEGGEDEDDEEEEEPAPAAAKVGLGRAGSYRPGSWHASAAARHVYRSCASACGVVIACRALASAGFSRRLPRRRARRPRRQRARTARRRPRPAPARRRPARRPPSSSSKRARRRRRRRRKSRRQVRPPPALAGVCSRGLSPLRSATSLGVAAQGARRVVAAPLCVRAARRRRARRRPQGREGLCGRRRCLPQVSGASLSRRLASSCFTACACPPQHLSLCLLWSAAHRPRAGARPVHGG